MIGVIGPLVQGKREVRGSVGSLARFGLGAVAGAFVTGSFIGILGGAAQALAEQHVLAVVVGAAGCLMLVADLRLFGLRTPTLRRQTCSTWYRERGARTAWVLWGFDLGLGFSTIRLSSLYWLMALFVAAFVSPVLAPLVLAIYGVGLTVAFVVATVAQRVSPDAASPGLGLLGAAKPVKLASDALLGMLSITIILNWGTRWL